MKALVLAAGKGTRLRPITDYIPKPMIPLHGKPLLEWVILHLMSYGIREYVIATSYLAEQIENYFGNGSRWGIQIEYSFGASPAGKAGEIWRCRALLSEEDRFLVVPGDTISHLNYSGFIQFHKRQSGIVSVALSTKYQLEVGLAEVDRHGYISNFFEKTNLNTPVSSGSYILDNDIFSYIESFNPDQREVDLPSDVFQKLLREGKAINGFVSDYDWWDVGRVNDYDALTHMPLEQAVSILAGHALGKNVDYNHVLTHMPQQ